MNKQIKENQKAPAFCLPNDQEKPVCLKDFLGKVVILYFYPKDNTPGCSTEAQDFTNLKKEFEKLNAVIIGISKDTCASHAKFINDQKLNIILLADTETKIIKKYSAWQEKKTMGKIFFGTVRTTVIINEKGIIKKIYNNVKAKEHAKQVLNDLK